MSIPAVGGGPAQGLQRALMEAAERALADEAEMLEGTGTGTASGAGTANAARAARRQALARAAGSDPAAPQSEEAIVVELTEGESEALTVADGWITTARRGPLEVRGEPVPQQFAAGDVKDGEAEATGAPAQSSTSAATAQTGQAATAGQAGQAAQTGQSGQAAQTGQPGETTQTTQPQPQPGQAQQPATAGQPGPASPTLAGPPPGPTAQATQSAQPGQPAPAPPSTASQQPPTPAAAAGPSIERLIVVLKQTGIDFRDAYQVLREIRGGEPLPSRAELRAQWQAADPGAAQEHATTAPERAAVPPAQQSRPEDLPVDDLIRDRTWHRAAAADPDRAAGPSLQAVVREDLASQQYVAGLSTAEFQRLVTILGGGAPAWFWELRGHRGLRGLAERPALARLNATRIAGTRLGAWILALLGMAVFWYIGVHSQIWW